MTGKGIRNRSGTALAIALSLAMCQCVPLPGAPGEGNKSAVRILGAVYVENLTAVSSGYDPVSKELATNPGDVLWLKLNSCDCPDKHRRWYYQYEGQEAQPLVFSENEWSLRLGANGKERLVGLNLSCGEAHR